MNKTTKDLLIDLAMAVSMILFVLLLMTAILDAVYPHSANAMEPGVNKQAVHLPTICKEFYNDGTDQWQRCMLVEKR